MRGWLFVSLGLLACKMENPAFGLQEGTDSTGGEHGDGTGPGDDGVPDGGWTGDGGGGTAGTGEDDGETDATEGSGTDNHSSEPDACDYGKTPPLKIVTERNQDQPPPCPVSVDGFFHAIEAVENGWLVQPCAGDGCSQCSPDEASALTFTLWPLAPQDLMGLGCLRVRLEGLSEDGIACNYDAATIWRASGSNQIPTLVASANSYGMPDAAATTMGGLQIELEKVVECSCEEVVDVPDCCESEPPAGYKLLAGDLYAYPGESVPVLIGPTGQEFEYQLHNVQSYFPGVCGADVIVAWAVMRP